MAVISGGDFQLEVRQSTGPDVYVVVADMHTFNNESRRGISNFPVFDKSTPYRKVGKPDDSFTVDGYDNPVGAARPGLAHRLPDDLAPAEDRLVPAGAVVTLDPDEQVGVGQAHPVAGGGPVEVGVTAPVQLGHSAPPALPRSPGTIVKASVGEG